jgi:cold-inducible RNA-binding protein
MSVRLFVGNLRFTVGDDELRQAFESAGEVARAEIVRDRFDGRSRGYAFVEMATDEGGAAALRDLNGRALGGRPMRVEIATSVRIPPHHGEAAR